MNISRLDLSRIACFFVELLILSFPCIRYAKTNKIDGVKLVRHSNRLKFIVFVVWEKVSVFRDNGKKIGLNGSDSKLIFVKNGTLIWFCAFYSFKTYSNISQWNAKRKRRCLFVIYRHLKIETLGLAADANLMRNTIGNKSTFSVHYYSFDTETRYQAMILLLVCVLNVFFLIRFRMVFRWGLGTNVQM